MPHRTNPLSEGSLLAAIDLGSNSFHLSVARLEHGELRPVHTLSEKVQLGAGLKQSRLDADAITRGLDCLARFGQVLDSVEPSRVRIVGTNALRQAKNRREFTAPAEAMLGIPVDVIYGREEARLIYLGVAHTLSDDGNSRLVVDIGGGSTEFIVGQRFEPNRLESLQLGCVSFANAFFPDGGISKRRYHDAYDQAMVEVSHIRRQFNTRNWDEAVGSSGTLQAIETLIRMEGWRDGGIDRKSLEKLKKRLLKHEHADDIDLEGLNDKRRRVITAGLAIASAIFDGLGIEVMTTSNGALREGVIYDLIGRLSHEDVRERSINAMLSRYGVDEASANVVGRRVTWLAESVADTWDFDEREIALLSWAGRCHELGITISQKHFNRHSAYLLLNSDLPGFSQGEQELLATLVRGQRGKLRPDLLDMIPEHEREKVSKMLVLLRLAVIFKWAEVLEELPTLTIDVERDHLKLSVPEHWCDSHPMTTWEINQAASVCKKLGVSVKLVN